MLDCVLRDEEEIQLTLEELIEAFNSDTLEALGGVLGISRALRVNGHSGLSYSNILDLKKRKDRLVTPKKNC